MIVRLRGYFGNKHNTRIQCHREDEIAHLFGPEIQVLKIDHTRFLKVFIPLPTILLETRLLTT